MSYAPDPHHRAYHPSHGHGGHRHAPTRPPQGAPRAALHRADEGYVFTHGALRIRIGAVAFWICVGSLVVMAIWTATTATYFAFKDDVLTRLIARQAEMQFAYEDRIAELRALVDRTTSRQLLDQELFEQKLGDILKRQSTLESRAGALSALPEAGLVTGAIHPTAAGATKVAEWRAGPPPITDTALFAAPPEREARLESRAFALASDTDQGADAPAMGSIVRQLQASLDHVEQRQLLALGAVHERIELRTRRMQGLLSDLGLDAGQIAAGGTGGPFIAAKPRASASEFERQLYRIKSDRAQMTRLQGKLKVVPYRKPVFGALSLSSGFGYRTDPFLGRPALHSGLDFRGDTGDPVRATAAGIVENAGWSGGYGRMIEIDHGNGLSTRYGHLSQIDVKVGERIQAGQVIGEIGSTGRSTGPHLHYETRIKGNAVNPQKFLRAGLKLDAG